MELKPDKFKPRFQFSRMNNTTIYYDPISNKPFFGLWEAPLVAAFENEITYKIDPRYAYRPDVISYMFFNTPFLDWAILFYNNIIDPFDEESGLYPHRLLKIPPTRFVFSKLG